MNNSSIHTFYTDQLSELSLSKLFCNLMRWFNVNIHVVLQSYKIIVIMRISKDKCLVSSVSTLKRQCKNFTTDNYVVQSLNSPFFPPPIGAEPGQAKGESRITCMCMLRTPPFLPPKSREKPYLEVFTADGKRQRLPLIIYFLLVILK